MENEKNLIHSILVKIKKYQKYICNFALVASKDVTFELVWKMKKFILLALIYLQTLLE